MKDIAELTHLMHMKKKMEKDREHLMEMLQEQERRHNSAGQEHNTDLVPVSGVTRSEDETSTEEISTEVALDSLDLSELIGDNTVKKKRHGRLREGRQDSRHAVVAPGGLASRASTGKGEEMDLSLAPSSRSLEWWRRLSSEFRQS